MTRQIRRCEISYRSLKVIGGGSLLVGAHHFFFAMSWSIVLSRSSSATSLLSRSTSSSSSRHRRSVSTLLGIVLLSPAIIGRLGDAVLATDVRDRQSLGQIAVGFASATAQPRRRSIAFSWVPPWAQSTRETPISAGPVFGEQARAFINSVSLATLGQLHPDHRIEVPPCLSPMSTASETLTTSTLARPGRGISRYWFSTKADGDLVRIDPRGFRDLRESRCPGVSAEGVPRFVADEEIAILRDGLRKYAKDRHCMADVRGAPSSSTIRSVAISIRRCCVSPSLTRIAAVSPPNDGASWGRSMIGYPSPTAVISPSWSSAMVHTSARSRSTSWGEFRVPDYRREPAELVTGSQKPTRSTGTLALRHDAPGRR